MRAIGRYTDGSMLHQGSSALTERPTSIDHVINQDTMSSVHITQYVHHFGFVRLLAAFIDDGKVNVQLLTK